MLRTWATRGTCPLINPSEAQEPHAGGSFCEVLSLRQEAILAVAGLLDESLGRPLVMLPERLGKHLPSPLFYNGRGQKNHQLFFFFGCLLAAKKGAKCRDIS